MNTKPKSNSVITVADDPIAKTLTFNVLGAGSVTLNVDQLHPAVALQATYHGLKQRISDAAALSRSTETGLPATPSEKLAAIRELVEHYNSGTSEWSLKRAASGGSDNGLLVQALLTVFPNKTAERVREYVKGLKPQERAALMASDMVSPAIAAIRAERTKGIDAEALIAGL